MAAIYATRVIIERYVDIVYAPLICCCLLITLPIIDDTIAEDAYIDAADAIQFCYVELLHCLMIMVALRACRVCCQPPMTP